MTAILLITTVAALVVIDLRWLRVAQREHYIAGSVGRFEGRWRRSSVGNVLLGIVMVVLLTAAMVGMPAPVVLLAVVCGCTPLGLSLRGRTSKLVWTRRCRTLAGATAVLTLAMLAALSSLVSVEVGCALTLVLAPSTIDLALLLTSPWERRHAGRFVLAAKERLAMVAPTVVAITGSYGKTSTKLYVGHLVGGHRTTLATPASFNNRGGLSRAINEQLADGTQVFVAEMGTYGRGEIAELCDICPPHISVLTAVGPVHLERFGTESAILAAKSEIFERAEVCVLNVDDPRLSQLADQLALSGKRTWRCGSTGERLDVQVVERTGGAVVRRGDEVLSDFDRDDVPVTNVACAVAVALELSVPVESLAGALPTLPVASHRQEVATNDRGVVIIDDTFNANPASVRRALALLQRQGSGRRVVVSPGMVELGPRQASENAAFGAAVAQVATDFVIVGRTNRRALRTGAAAAGAAPRSPGPLDVEAIEGSAMMGAPPALDGAASASTDALGTSTSGADGVIASAPVDGTDGGAAAGEPHGAPLRIVTARTLAEAVEWVRTHTEAGDAVLYANDLPDHYA